jgi:DNA-binding transcriptional MocR family regulator
VSAGPTSERVHQGLRELIMAKRYRPGARLEPAELTSLLLASTTPVREALNQLVGEGLVETRSGGGFHVPLVDEPGLKDLYAWSGEIIQLALRAIHLSKLAAIQLRSEDNVAAAATFLLQDIATASVNREHGSAMTRINARLFASRLGEQQIWDDAEKEIGALAELARRGDVPGLRQACSAYHRRRIRTTAKLLHHLYREE